MHDIDTQVPFTFTTVKFSSVRHASRPCGVSAGDVTPRVDMHEEAGAGPWLDATKQTPRTACDIQGFHTDDAASKF